MVNFMTDKRIPWNQYFMLQAVLLSLRSTCERLSVGAILVRDKRVIAGGYNGAVSGDDHFEPDRYDHPDVFPQDQSRSGGCFGSVDHDGKRSRGGRDILWACRRVAGWDASGWLRSYLVMKNITPV